MKKIATIIFLLPLLIFGQKLTLKQSLDLGLKQSKELKSIEIKKKIAEYQTSEILSEFFPKFYVGASYARLSSVPPFEVNVPFAPMPIKIQETFLNYYSLKAGFQLPIFVGFKLTSLLQSAKENLKAEELELLRKRNEKAFEIINSFWQVKKAELGVTLLEESLKRFNTHLREVKNYLQNGKATKNDYLKTELKISNLKVKLAEAKSGLKIAKLLFNKNIGRDLSSQVELVGREPKEESFSFDLEKLLDEGLKNRIEIKEFERRTASSEEMVSASKSEWFPSVVAFGNYYYSRPNQRYLPLEDEFKDSWELGVSLNWTIFDWSGRTSKIKIAETQVEIQKLNLSILKENIKTEITNNYLTLKNLFEKIKSYKLAVESAKENLRVTNQLFKESSAKTSDVIDAENELLNAETNYKNALIDFEVAKQRLFKSVGRIIY